LLTQLGQVAQLGPGDVTGLDASLVHLGRHPLAASRVAGADAEPEQRGEALGREAVVLQRRSGPPRCERVENSLGLVQLALRASASMSDVKLLA
jgi:hypothetical protein